ncbi:hypothetical protein ASPZODRAFT_126582 [Penicilliopsis zonata CBS 506.65]|uniref:Transglycosylase SLT domain-containing protein n=1 Tax=Penicilliopsis zonata CBS 506.65 TaxID=1073090 RepID=A0A1L9STY5_9EURO|nr:hypothetical protein ASPZODRAFT_126582 [Penicilliopsis zonata CBS 506.65]OJJ50659.1 hypothetical protein ASPZODRAFT_126582 [Penicilliopsis zonata CBS 506.65]
MFLQTILFAICALVGLTAALPLPMPVDVPVTPTPTKNSPITKRATGETVTNTAVAVYTVDNSDGLSTASDSYTMYTGDGTVADGWPAMDDWLSFDAMFEANRENMRSSCENDFDLANNSEEEMGYLRAAIDKIAAETYVDHRLILAVIIQESAGCVRVPATVGSVSNPGLMQDHDGTGTCNNDGDVNTPCPAEEIEQMVSDGTAGTATGDGLANCLNEADTDDVSAFYRAARIYNSGSVASDGDLGSGDATHCYASDIANRLTGWVDATCTCTLDD